MITPYSVISAIIWSNIFIVILYLLRTKKFTINAFGIIPIVLITASCILRLFICFDLPFTRGVFIYDGFASFVEWISKPMFSFWNCQVTIKHILIIVWLVGTILGATNFVCASIRFHINCRKRIQHVNSDVIDIAKSIASEYGISRYQVFNHPLVSEPMVYGVITPTILLPTYGIDRDEMKFILTHELYHIAHHDILIKACAEIIRIVFWWNPFSSLFCKELNHVLELRNDNGIIKKKSEEYRCGYALAIVNMAKKAALEKSELAGKSGVFCGFVSKKHETAIAQRVNLVLNYKTQPIINACGLYLLIVALFIASHSFVIQPGWEPSEEQYGDTFALDSETIENSYFVPKENGMYELFINGESFGEVYPEEVEKPPFNEIRKER